MKPIRFRVALLVALLVLTLTACGGGSKKAEPTSPPEAPAQPTAQAGEPTQPPVPTDTPSAEQPQPTEPVEAATPEIPYDIPIMEGASQLEIQGETNTVIYVMEETMIEDVIEFYKTKMPEQGWETVSTSEVGLMATLVFQSDVARVSISLQANNIAKTVNVRLFVVKK